MARVVVIGSVNRDRVVRCLSLPVPGETVVALTEERSFGGKGGNQACAAARMGARTLIVAAVGADEVGVAAGADLRAYGVDTAALVGVPGSRTGAADVYVDQDGENFIVLFPGANAALSGAAVTQSLAALGLSAVDVMLSSGEIDPAAVEAAAMAAQDAGARHVHNLAPFRPLGPWGRHDRMLVVANAVEARQATGQADPFAAARTLAAGRGAGVVTLGARGAVAASGDHVHHLSAPPVTAVDTTGAGDAFCGAFAAALAQGQGLEAATGLAVLAGAVAVTGPGARGALATRQDLL